MKKFNSSDNIRKIQNEAKPSRTHRKNNRTLLSMIKKIKKCLTVFDNHGKITRSSEMNDTRKRNKKFRKKV